MSDERRVAERRTMALRGPGAGGFTPAQSVAASNPCLNCGTNIQLEYCPECGQREIDSDPTLKEYLRELAEEFLRWDGKLANTFRALVTRPGVLTLEYLSGRRVRYLSPVRLYLTCSVVFFLLHAVVPDRTVATSTRAAPELAKLESAARDAERSSSPLRRYWTTHYVRSVRNPEAQQRFLSAAPPKLMFVLVPLFAAIVGLVYRDRRRKYPQHLAFALHVHAALFLILLLVPLARLIPSAAVAGAIGLLVVVPLALVYFWKAARSVYEGSRGQVTARVALASALYFAAFVVSIVVLYFASVLLT